MFCIHKEYYSANARYLSDEAIKDIKTSFGRVPDAINTMAKNTVYLFLEPKNILRIGNENSK